MNNHLETFDVLARITAEQAKHQSPINSIGSDHQAPSIETLGANQPATSPELETAPYPLDALPPIIQKAVIEVQEFVKAPLALVAASALSATSLASQGLASIERASGLVGPCGLFFITIADSGERKSTCDKFFIDPIRAWQAGEAQRLEAQIKAFKAQYAGWKAEVEGLESLVKSEARKRKPTTNLQGELAEVMSRQPVPPKVPDLLYADATPEALGHGLTKWPSAGLMAHEGGVVFGGHAMSADAAMRNFALLDSLWDGMPHQVRRRTSESYEIKNARLTIGLQVQTATIRQFMVKQGELARGIGFFARCLISWPESTQGSRFYCPPPAAWPSLSAFQARITELLNRPLQFDEAGHLTLPVVTLNPMAQASWIAFHNEVERMLAKGQSLADVRDVGAKAADNAARLACLFQIFEHGPGTIGVAAMESAIRIVAWHLQESRRFLTHMDQAEEVVDSQRLLQWLRDYCVSKEQTVVDRNFVLRHGPLRKSIRLQAALAELEAQGFLNQLTHGRKVVIAVNPRAVNGAH